MQSGADDYIEKPICLPVLTSRVRNQIARKLAVEKLIKTNRRLSEIVQEKTEELNARHEFVSAMLDNLQEGIIACDNSGNLVHMNSSAQEFLGIDGPLEKTRPDFDQCKLFQPDGVTRLERDDFPLNRALRGEPFERSELMIRKDGHKPLIVNTSGQAMRDRSGMKLGAVVSMHDITKHRDTEQLAKKSEKRYRDIYKKTPAMLQSVDKDGKLINVSDYWLERLGYSRDEVLGKPMVSFLSHDSHRYLRDAAFQNFYKLGYCKNIAVQFVSKQGEVVETELSGMIEYDAEGQMLHSLEVIVDVSERKAAEQKFLQAQKMEAIGQLTGGMAHDFNNLLTVIFGNLQLMDRSLAQDDESVRPLLKGALEATRRGADLTRALLNFSHQQPAMDETIDIGELIDNMQEILKRTLGEEIEIVNERDPALWQVHVDRNLLQSTILNLAINAKHAMTSGGRLTISVANRKASGTPSAQDEDWGDYLEINVRDTGDGIPAEILPKIFEPFFSTKQEGSGLGLAMVKGYITKSNGRIFVESKKGHGTCFTIHLPRSIGQAEQVESTADNSTSIVSNNAYKILVVEDKDEVRTVAVSLLKELGHQVQEASNSAAALEILKDDPSIDLLFTDIVMPGGLNGVALAMQAKEMRPELKVLYASGYANVLSMYCEAEDSKLNTILKPYSSSELGQKIELAACA